MTLDEIKTAIINLSPEEFREFRIWFVEFMAAESRKQIEIEEASENAEAPRNNR